MVIDPGTVFPRHLQMSFRNYRHHLTASCSGVRDEHTTSCSLSLRLKVSRTSKFVLLLEIRNSSAIHIMSEPSAKNIGNHMQRKKKLRRTRRAK